MNIEYVSEYPTKTTRVKYDREYDAINRLLDSEEQNAIMISYDTFKDASNAYLAIIQQIKRTAYTQRVKCIKRGKSIYIVKEERK